MNRLLLLVLTVVFIAAGIGVFSWQQGKDPKASRQRMLSAFLASLPDSLDRQRRDEIASLFNNFYLYADRGDVDPTDVAEINHKVVRYVQQGEVSADSLVYLMAQVGYYTYKMDPRKNLTSGEVDHPILNPAAGAMEVRRDSTFWEEFEEWKRTHVYQRGDTVVIKVENPGPRSQP